MISTGNIRQLFAKSERALKLSGYNNEALEVQFHRGVAPRAWPGQHPGGCERHMAVFESYNAIPEYCFSCYKIVVEPGNVIELFKLMMIFEHISLPNDNTRKCMVECRQDVAGWYKGLVYCRSAGEAQAILAGLGTILAEQISGDMPMMLKRGCSEYGLAYPEYAKVDQDTAPMEYRPQWREFEARVDENLSDGSRNPVNSADTRQPGYTVQDAKAMLAWVKYAATIGDTSYLQITGAELPPFENLKRPDLFQPRAPKRNPG